MGVGGEIHVSWSIIIGEGGVRTRWKVDVQTINLLLEHLGLSTIDEGIVEGRRDRSGLLADGGLVGAVSRHGVGEAGHRGGEGLKLVEPRGGERPGVHRVGMQLDKGVAEQRRQSFESEAINVELGLQLLEHSMVGPVG